MLDDEGGNLPAAPVAQRTAQLPSKQTVPGSSPGRGALVADFSFPSGPSNDEIAREWLRHQRDQRRRRPITNYQYAARIDQFFAWIGDVPLGSVPLGLIEGWLARPRTGSRTRAADATIAKECAILRGLYKYASGRGYVSADPTLLLVTPTVRNRNPKPVPDDVWTRVWASAALPNDAVLTLGLGYFVGLRRSEIVSIRAANVHTREGTITALERKGGGDDTIHYGDLLGVVADGRPDLCPKPERFLDALDQAVRERAGQPTLLAWGDGVSPRAQRVHSLPPGGVDPQLIYRRLRGWLRVAGVDDAAFTPHQLRHSFVTNLLRPPINMPIHLVSVLANHSSVSVTMAYAKLGGQELREWRRNRANDSTLRSDHDRWASP